MSFYVYIIQTVKSKILKTYVGYTIDLKRRLKNHNQNKGAKSTKGHKMETNLQEKIYIKI